MQYIWIDLTYEQSGENALKVASAVAKDDESKIFLDSKSVDPTRDAYALCTEIGAASDFSLYINGSVRVGRHHAVS